MTSLVPQSNTNLISQIVNELRSFCQVDILSSWLCREAIDIEDITLSDFSDWSVAKLNDKKHIPWDSGQKVLWLVQKVVVPEHIKNFPLQNLCLRLGLVWWADSAQIYLNGNLVGEGDLFDCFPRILLSSRVSAGEEFTIALRLVSPKHDYGALVKSVLFYETTNGHPEPSFIADELAVLQKYLDFTPQKLDDLVEKLQETSNHLQNNPDSKELEALFVNLRNLVYQTTAEVKRKKIYLLGHAHLDLAWLWSVSETWIAAQNTFESVLKLQLDFPELIFCHSTPALYAWIEENRPDLFTRIQEAVDNGKWEVLGGLWVEPELNLIAGESIVRQLLYGQRYIQEKFGKISPIAWLPDTFGFCATLPQFFQQAGIEYFVTQKLRWNDTTKFDYGAFWWRSPDGSQVFSYMSAPIGEAIDAEKMAAYACEWQAQTDVVDALWLPGVGDHGGGPTRDMLEMARRFDDSSLPQLEFTTAEKYLQQISTNNQIPTWNDELYLEFHRGCYTTHGDQKRWNRKSENLLYQAELFAALASITCGVAYPKLELETAWKQVLFNQFHDILPGSSITQVYTDALPQWEAVAKVGQEILEKSLIALASHTTLPTPPHENAVPVFVFNPLNWERSEVVAIDLPQSWENACIYDLAGILPSQLSESGKVLFLASKIPSVGDRVFWICPQPKNGHSIAQYDDSKTGLRKQEHFALERLTLENEFLRVTIDEKTGDLSSVFDKVNHKEILRGNGNQLQAFRDSGQYWDAWNIDPNYAQHPLAATQLKSIDWVEQGIVRNCIRVVRVLGESEFCSDYILDVNSPILKIATTVNWQERHVLVKAAFPLNVESDFATYEIPCGVIKRPTKPETAAEKAKWEVPALHWADITAASGGVSLLNDCKYGYDSQPNQLRLTLLRGSTWPDPEADKGFHEFTYALYPHSESWESAGTVRRGYELNIPLQIISQQNPTASGKPADNLGRSLINLSADNLILMAFKQAEDNPQQWILRCYECHGAMVAHLDLQGIGLTLTEPVDLLERPLSVPVSSEQQSFTIQPWKIRSFKGQV